MRGGIAWTLVSEDQSGETLILEDCGAPRSEVENDAPYGHGGVIPSGTPVAAARADDGGTAFAAYVPRPSWALVADDVYSTTPSGLGILISDSTGFITLNASAVLPLFVGRHTDPVMIEGYVVGTISATTTVVKAG